MLPELEAKSTGQNQGRNRLNAVSSVDCEVRAGFDDCSQEPKSFIAELPGASKRNVIPISTSSRSRHNTVHIPRLCLANV